MDSPVVSPRRTLAMLKQIDTALRPKVITIAIATTSGRCRLRPKEYNDACVCVTFVQTT